MEAGDALHRYLEPDADLWPTAEESRAEVLEPYRRRLERAAGEAVR